MHRCENESVMAPMLMHRCENESVMDPMLMHRCEKLCLPRMLKKLLRNQIIAYEMLTKMERVTTMDKISSETVRKVTFPTTMVTYVLENSDSRGKMT